MHTPEDILHEAERTDVPLSGLKVGAIRFRMLEDAATSGRLSKEQQMRADQIRAVLARKVARVRHAKTNH